MTLVAKDLGFFYSFHTQHSAKLPFYKLLSSKAPPCPLPFSKAPSYKMSHNKTNSKTCQSYVLDKKDKKDVFAIKNINLCLKTGLFYAIIGPNGSGKSTLQNLLCGFYKAKSGLVLLEGQDITKIKPQTRALYLSHIANEGVFFSGNVFDFVLYGRFPHTKKTRGYTQQDKDIATASLKKLGIEGLKDDLLKNLSSGQRQKVLLAQCLAQNSKMLFLDEGSSFLDIKATIEFMQILQELAKNGFCVCAIMHDIQQALFFADNIIVLDNGSIFFSGKTGDFEKSNALGAVFGIKKTNGAFPFEILH